MNKSTLELLLDVRDTRKQAAEDKVAKETLMRMPGIVDAVSAHVASRKAQKEAEDALRTHCLSPTIGDLDYIKEIKIKSRKGFSFDNAVALDWCKEEFAAAVVLDTKAFTNYLKTAKNLPMFVAKTETDFVAISQDLSNLPKVLETPHETE